MKKLNNKGFSLVELIIVIAIMAILVGVVGTQVIPYLENSRKAKDTQILSAWNTAAVSAYSTEAGNLDSTATYTITIGTGAITYGSSVSGDSKGEEALEKTFKELTNLGASYDFKGNFSSKSGKAIKEVKIWISGANGDVITKVTDVDTGVYSKATTKDFDPIENK